ncbi:competence type IV pilus minor pilin ComGD [Kurthia massiliensis]|uniref:competence type IV pilus minor pilin ComGD n=1 Tax=Kurthia massiliensis TaxID=1033739 RepID=UPI00028A37C2|nr:competence type IV pilus minor pilin ComGD [Kurthia massiliensis]
MRANKGFTFIEMLIVLTIALIIVTVTSQYGHQKWTQLEATLYLEQILKDIQYVQSEAKKTETYTEIQFEQLDNRWQYNIVTRVANKANVIKTRQLPVQIQVVTSDSTTNFFRYTDTGRPSLSGHMTFRTAHHTYRLTVYLGEGIAKLEKES